MTALSDNPAVTDPRAHLTPAERDALVSVDFYARQALRAGFVVVGKKRFSRSTISALQRKHLLKGEVPQLSATLAGKLAIHKLRNDR